MVKTTLLTLVILSLFYAKGNFTYAGEASKENTIVAFSKRFQFNTQRDIAPEITAESKRFAFSSLRDIETEITAVSSAFNFNTDRNIEWEITALSPVFTFNSSLNIQPQIVAQSLPFSFNTSRNIESQIIALSSPFPFNTSRDIESQIIALSSPFPFNTSRDIAQQITSNSNPFVFNTLRNIAQQITAYSDPFLFNTSNNIAVILVGESDAFLYNTTRDIAFQIIALAEFIPLFDPLPIELLSFTAFENNNQIDLQWATASETNNHFFTILRSNNGLGFEPLSMIQGAGNSLETLHYQYTDQNPLSGVNYYKLRQTDFDGSQSESHIVAVYFLAGHEADISVTYHSGFIHIKLPWNKPEKASYVLFDTMGRKIRTGSFEHFPGQQSLIGVQDIQNGVLLFSLSGNNTVYNKKLLKY